MYNSENWLLGIKKLLGRENYYNTWKLGMEICLNVEDMWCCIIGDERDEKKDATMK